LFYSIDVQFYYIFIMVL